jgi:putative ABC transport system permease protein
MGSDIDKIRFVEETFNVDIESGRGVRKGELDKVVLGYNYKIADKIFERPVILGDKVEINDVKFTVVGFYSSLGNPQDDGNIYVSKEAFEKMYPNSTEKYSFVIARADDGVSTKELAEKVQERLRKYKNQEKGKEDFFVQTFEDAIQTFQTIISVINGILVLIALISVVVAAVNIMNTMYTAVLERTGEIGIMKAVGAKNTDILFIFLIEAGFIGLIGGILGVITGFIVATIGGAAAAGAGFSLLKPVFPISLIIGCITFSFLIGAVAGLLPAIGASKLKPVEALRYE